MILGVILKKVSVCATQLLLSHLFLGFVYRTKLVSVVQNNSVVSNNNFCKAVGEFSDSDLVNNKPTHDTENAILKTACCTAQRTISPTVESKPVLNIRVHSKTHKQLLCVCRHYCCSKSTELTAEAEKQRGTADISDPKLRVLPRTVCPNILQEKGDTNACLQVPLCFSASFCQFGAFTAGVLLRQAVYFFL